MTARMVVHYVAGDWGPAFCGAPMGPNTAAAYVRSNATCEACHPFAVTPDGALF